VSAAPDVSRRDFVKTSGALVVGFALAPRVALAQDRPAPLPGSLNTNRMLDAWLRIDPNGTVTIFTGKIELGQGIGTALSQIAADELDVSLERIQVVSGDTARTPNEGQTAGSLSVEQSGTAVRFACAEARDMLVSAAAAKLGVPATDLKVSEAITARRRGGDVLGARGKRRSEARGDREGETEARLRAPLGRPQRSSAGHSEEIHRRRRLRAGYPPPRHGIRTRRASALAWRGAPVRRRGSGTPHARRRRRRARWQFPRRGRRARGAGDSRS
jgi:CO/xanthine dehydrogenase Mo-binding subunit